jgi:hypothetical protein
MFKSWNFSWNPEAIDNPKYIKGHYITACIKNKTNSLAFSPQVNYTDWELNKNR